jgi:uncharacterized Zn finger protein
MDDVVELKKALKKRWSRNPSTKAKRYIEKFWDRTRRGQRIMAQVEGNHGTYRVSVGINNNVLDAACSCYKGKHGYCHHCAALAYTFLDNPDSFVVITPIPLAQVATMDDLKRYLEATTLDELITELKAKSITQKAFAESIGMSSQKVGTIKRNELQGYRVHELAAVKLACVWVLQNLTKGK